ncbi:MAG: hypothetical protein RUMPE_00917 [Eubacteriales bacterium SKADARSKE-1]|nr:hypothetical protein [Eubacteriales bacterium SKADARSKE-1]
MRFWTPKLCSKTNVNLQKNEQINSIKNQTENNIIDNYKQIFSKEAKEDLYLKSLYKIQQRNILKTECIVTDIIKNLKAESPAVLLLKAVKCIEAITGDTVTYKLVLKALKENNELR